VAGDLDGENGERGTPARVAEAGEGLEPGILVGGAEEDEQDNVQDEYPEFACGDEATERGRKGAARPSIRSGQ